MGQGEGSALSASRRCRSVTCPLCPHRAALKGNIKKHIAAVHRHAPHTTTTTTTPAPPTTVPAAAAPQGSDSFQASSSQDLEILDGCCLAPHTSY
ncbi:hypothetical protein E2C01_101745 [Portunus trituberculatus]|uniref:C2H2-type domain-containing protein n=1 Tax=Portunus trituberculatus TaxID=210409 RepID=A0A5B7KFM7_PORTR|nr:hypothetical protein [Portunus trituberculatus]